MKIVIAGCRDFKADGIINWVETQADEIIKHYLKHGQDEFEIIHGGARGIDFLADTYAEFCIAGAKQSDFGSKLKFTKQEFLPDYNKYPPKVAPIMRNKEMAKYGDVLLAFWDGKSRGTRNMIDEMLALGKETHVYIWSES